jgi:cell division protein FtsZ
MIFVCCGLGGGTGSGAAPAVAQVAREAGSLVIVFATMPFAFEGKRRTAQAQEALAKLRDNADAVICFENDRMGDMVAPKAGIHQAFAVADVTISQSVRSIVSLIQRPGLIRIGFDDLLAALRSPNGRCLFGFGESDSGNRAHDALTQALKNPLMDRGRMLADASHVLVQVAGGPAMTLSEVEILMKELGKHISDRTQILFGTSVDGRMGNRLSVTLISSLATEEKAAPAPAKVVSFVKPEPAPQLQPEPVVPPAPPIWEQREEPELSVTPETIPAPAASQMNEELMQVAPEEEAQPDPEPVAYEPEAIMEEAPPPPRVILPRKKPVPFKEPKPFEEKKPKQEVLQFEPVTRGRFEKSEPTIVEGQDLDIPTFLRKNVRVK